ncbi:CDP-alcohol phosphatidyltransferase family protein [Halomarina halobia]|uniref:CDP-alcohol phosphatidyltransferase family protein n=1 Tax=Halomarina halobia TaxID=3033386 RepID=A0ABD6ACK8_9EURY|nr:CDP-alcohol phosphatidyltransferase family protein [Halomarina sp. PSR21]
MDSYDADADRTSHRARSPSDGSAATDRLRRGWAAAVAAGIVALVGGASALAVAGPPGTGLRWLVGAGALLGAEAALLWRALGDNRTSAGGPLLPTLGLANALTLVRGLALSGVAGFLLLPPPSGALAWIPGLLYGTAVLLDQLDGRVARGRGRTTLLGVRLDTAFDTVGLLVAPVLAVRYGQLPVWYLAVSAARYVFLAGLFLRRRRGRPIAPLPERPVRRVLAGVQMAVVSLALLPVLGPPTTTVLATAAMLPFLAQFARDWSAVTSPEATGSTPR